MNNRRENSTVEYESRGLDSSNAHPSKMTPSPNRNGFQDPLGGHGLGGRYDVEDQLKQDE